MLISLSVVPSLRASHLLLSLSELLHIQSLHVGLAEAFKLPFRTDRKAGRKLGRKVNLFLTHTDSPFFIYCPYIE